MISIKRLMKVNEQETLEAYRRTSALLMQAMALHSVEGEPAEFDMFRNTVNELLVKVNEPEQPSDVLIAAGAAARALQEYSRRTTQFMKAQSVELQAIIAMLTRTMSEVSSGSESSIKRLQEIEQKLSKAGQIDDLRTLKLRMADCLDAVRDEAAHRKREADRLVDTMRADIETARQKKSAVLQAPVDTSTGLLSRVEAEAALKSAAASDKPAYVAVFVLGRVQAINSRFGHAMAEKVMGFFLDSVRSALASDDRVFRWNEASYLAILEREDCLEHVRREIGRHLFRKSEQTFEFENRAVVVPISAASLIVPVSAHALSATLAELDAFASRTAA